MKTAARSSLGRYLWAGGVFAFAVHILVLASLVVFFDLLADDEDEEEPEESIEVVLDDRPITEADLADLADDELPKDIDDLASGAADAEEDEKEEEEPDQKEDEEEVEEPPQDQPQDDQVDEALMEHYAVDQVTDDVEPDQADHISDEAHRTEEETVAEMTTLDDVEPTDDPEAQQQEADTDRELAMQTPDEPIEEPDIVDPTDIADADEDDDSDDEEEQAEEEQEHDEIADDSDDEAVDEQQEAEDRRQYRDSEEMFVEQPAGDEAPRLDDDIAPRDLFGRNAQRAEEILETEQGDGSDQAPSEGGRSGRRLLSNWRENDEAMRASLENFVPHVQPGNHTSVNAHAADHASYIARLHRTIHANWGNGFLPRIQSSFSNAHPLNDMSLQTVVEIVVDADSGEVVETGRVQPSGNEMFDGAALNIARNLGDQPEPPDSIVSPDGKAYIHWTFWRDVRQCGTFGVRIYQLQDDDQRRSVDDG